MTEVSPNTQQVPVKDTIKKVEGIASKAGQERRERFGKTVNNFFQRAKETFNNGVNMVFGAPEAAVYLGRETYNIAENAVNSALDATTETANRWANNIDRSTNRLSVRFNEADTRFRKKISEKLQPAINIGLKIGAFIEGKIANAIYGIPAFITEFRRDNAANSFTSHQENMITTETTEEAEIRKIVEAQNKRIEEIRSKYSKKSETMREAVKASREKRDELSRSATEARKNELNFGIFRKKIAALPTTG